MTIDHSENAGIEAVATNLYKEDRSIDGIDGIFLGKLFRLNFRLQDFVEKCAHDTAPSHVLGHAALGNWPDVSAPLRFVEKVTAISNIFKHFQTFSNIFKHSKLKRI